MQKCSVPGGCFVVNLKLSFAVYISPRDNRLDNASEVWQLMFLHGGSKYFSYVLFYLATYHRGWLCIILCGYVIF